MAKTPTHKITISRPPDYVPRVVSEVVPTGKAKCRGYCKYCYTTHRDWWQMPSDECFGKDVVLCGKCEHASLKEAI